MMQSPSSPVRDRPKYMGVQRITYPRKNAYRIQSTNRRSNAEANTATQVQQKFSPSQGMLMNKIALWTGSGAAYSLFELNLEYEELTRYDDLTNGVTHVFLIL
ncbi:unnamed protein product [Clavelina lepadiformis]|uniref:Uncharacterized protein n=1 Tax=Clavelina lepadiformis TaxID=159417 RepID=A0ABP0GEG6_CLALP